MRVENDGGDIVIEENPFACAVWAAGEKDFKRIVSGDAETAPAGMAEEMFHFGGPLGMGGAAKAEAIGEETGPIFAGAEVAFGEAVAPEIFRAFFAMRVMGIAPEPGGEGFVVVGGGGDAGGALVLFGLGGEETFKGRTGQFTGIPGVIGFDLGVTDACKCRRSGESQQERSLSNQAAHGVQTLGEGRSIKGKCRSWEREASGVPFLGDSVPFCSILRGWRPKGRSISKGNRSILFHFPFRPAG